LQKSEAYDLVVPQVHGRLHPLVGAYRTQIRSQVEALLAQGEYRMKALLDATNSCILDLSNHPEFGDDHLYINLNTPEEVKLWE
jgi:molybdopterin-guanine dinucleotide biosynthesis protein A